MITKTAYQIFKVSASKSTSETIETCRGEKKIEKDTSPDLDLRHAISYDREVAPAAKAYSRLRDSYFILRCTRDRNYETSLDNLNTPLNGAKTIEFCGEI